MTPNKLFFTGLFFIYIGATECPKDFIEINESCYLKKHIDVLQDIIDINEILRDMEPQNIGAQEWKDGKLTYLYLGDHQLTTIPDSIGLRNGRSLGNIQLQRARTKDPMVLDGLNDGSINKVHGHEILGPLLDKLVSTAICDINGLRYATIVAGHEQHKLKGHCFLGGDIPNIY